MPHTPDPSESLAVMLESDIVEKSALWTVEEVFANLIRYPDTGGPGRYTDAAVVKRADSDIAFDLAQDVKLGFTHTDAQAAEYRRRYRLAFLQAWRDPALWTTCQEKYRPRGYIIVCMR